MKSGRYTKTLADKTKEHLEKTGLTIQDLVRATDLPRGSFYRILQNDGSIQYEAGMTLKKYLLKHKV